LVLGPDVCPEVALQEICDGILRIGRPELLMGDLFEVLERFPEEFLGAPGPVIRTLESMPGYQEALQDSARRSPNSHTLFMMMRIVNSLRSAREKRRWLRLIRKIADDASLDYLAEEAAAFLSEQADLRFLTKGRCKRRPRR
jgi:hypothetical protein